MRVLIIVEHNGQRMHAGTRQVMSAALQCAQDIELLVIGHDCRTVAEEVACLKGASRVLLADAPCYTHALAEPLSELVLSMAAAYSHIMMSSTSYGKNLLPRIAAGLDVGQVSDVTRIIDANTFEHPIYAGNALEKVRVLDDKKVLSLRATAFDALLGQQEACVIDIIDARFSSSSSRFVEHQLSESSRPDLSTAKRVVSGGRGLQSMEKFKLIEQLADALGAAVGASRAAVDAGFVPNEYQVGQTGKVVAPELYIAVGISGAVQHLAGMKDSKVIVAINKDPDAPIFQIANYALLGDLFVLVPELIEALTALKKE
jgi:electron transfer flavoprotein alpha subunit